MLANVIQKVSRAILLVVFAIAVSPFAQTQQRTASSTPTHADILRGEYGRYRANNDLLSYHLDIRVDPAKKFVSGKNTIRFRMLKDDTRIQLDLYDNLNIDKILFASTGQGAKGKGAGEDIRLIERID